MTRFVPIGTYDGEYIDAETLGQMETDAYSTIDKSTQVQADWDHDPVTGDQFPKGETAEKDSGIGTLTKPAGHVAIGNPTVADGQEGNILRRDAAGGGGMLIIAARDIDPQNPPAWPPQGNNYLELNGAAIIISGGGLWLQVSNPITADHEILVGPSTTISDGRHFSPLILGPEKVYQHSDEQTDNRDIDVFENGENLIVTLTLTNNYAIGVSTFSFFVLLENNATRTTDFDIIIKVDNVEIARTSRSVTGGQVAVSGSVPLEQALTSGQVITMHVESFGTHPSSEGWVRGSVQQSLLRVKQG